mgnify:CR=1 FL=1
MHEGCGRSTPPGVNYRHVHHAGNFADLVKHAALLHLLAEVTARPEPLLVIDTHAGAGLYPLADSRTGEAEAGVVRLMAEPSPPLPFAPLIAAVRRLNGDGSLLRYPGSPLLIAEALRPGDRLIACELRPDDGAALTRSLSPLGRRAECLQADGYLALRNRLPPDATNALLLIDPPYERGDEYAQAVRAIGAALDRAPRAVVCLWAPVKDLETFDALVRDLERIAPGLLVAECRLRPLTDPLRLNGCALALINAPATCEPVLAEIMAWTAARLGQRGGAGRVWRP